MTRITTTLLTDLQAQAESWTRLRDVYDIKEGPTAFITHFVQCIMSPNEWNDKTGGHGCALPHPVQVLNPKRYIALVFRCFTVDNNVFFLKIKQNTLTYVSTRSKHNEHFLIQIFLDNLHTKYTSELSLNYLFYNDYETSYTTYINHARWHRCLRSGSLRVGGNWSTRRKPTCLTWWPHDNASCTSVCTMYINVQIYGSGIKQATQSTHR